MNLSETAEVLAAIAKLREQKRPMALATIIGVTGSTYRRPGARLLVPATGESVGNLSGGCLEGEVEQLARDVMESGRPRTAFFDLTADDEAVWGWGLGCNGAIEVFVEPGARAAEVADALADAIAQERPIALGTVVESSMPEIPAGARVIVHPDGRREGTLGDGGADELVGGAALEALAAGWAGIRRFELPSGEMRAFIERFAPPLRLLVCGAGHDAIPLVKQGAELGWNVVVVDDRPGFLTETRFPGARKFVHARPTDAALAGGADERTYAVVMSHNYLRDRDYLRSFLGSEVGYVGMLGPRARLERLLADLRGQGIAASEQDLAKLHGPAGLDLGSEGPEEIAAAVVAEILAVERGRAAGFLRDRSGPIHERPETVGSKGV